MPLRYALCRSEIEFHKNQIGDDVIVTSFKFPKTIIHISNSIEPTDFVLGTSTQEYNVHLTIEMKVTWAVKVGQRQRAKVTKNELMVIFRKLILSVTSYLEPSYNTISDI